MKCTICKNGEFVNSVSDYQTKFHGEYIVVKNVPVQECNVCGEQILSYETIKKVEEYIQSNKKPVAYIEVPIFDMAAIFSKIAIREAQVALKDVKASEEDILHDVMEIRQENIKNYSTRNIGHIQHIKQI